MSLSSLLFRRRRGTDTPPPPPLPMQLSPPPPLSTAIPHSPLLGLKTIAVDHFLSSAASDEEEAEAESEEEEEEEEEEEKDDDDNNDDDDDNGDERCCWASYGRRCGMRRLPPPITVVAKAGEKKCLMPWVLRRSYEDGGRLVLREVEVKHQEYLKASREGGRLTLKIIHVEPPLLPATELPENDGEGPPPAWPSSILSSMAALSSSSPEAMACHEDPRPRSIFNPVAAVHS